MSTNDQSIVSKNHSYGGIALDLSNEPLLHAILQALNSDTALLFTSHYVVSSFYAVSSCCSKSLLKVLPHL